MFAINASGPEAGQSKPTTVRSLDAIHLATALRARPTSLITYDKRLADAAREAGLAVEMPGT